MQQDPWKLSKSLQAQIDEMQRGPRQGISKKSCLAEYLTPSPHRSLTEFDPIATKRIMATSLGLYSCFISLLSP